MGLWERIKNHFRERRKKYEEWAMKNKKQNINENYEIRFHEIGFLYALTLWFLFIVLLINTLLLFYHHEVVIFIKWYLRLMV